MKGVVFSYFLTNYVGDEVVDEVTEKLKGINFGSFTAVCTNIKEDEQHNILNIQVDGKILDEDKVAGQIQRVLSQVPCVGVEFFEVSCRQF